MEINQSDDNSNSLSASIQEALSKLPPLSPKRCIYRTPEKLRQVNKRAYTPMVVSIGPYHRKDKRLLPMEVHKLRYLQFFVDASKSIRIVDINTFLSIVKNSESKIRECYEDATMIDELSSDEFNKMVLIDSTFVIWFMVVHLRQQGRKGEDQIFGRPFRFGDVYRDIMLAENQLPFFILNDLYRAAFEPDKNPVPSFVDLACKLLKNLDNIIRIPMDDKTGEMTYCHLLHLLQTGYLPSKRKEPEEKQPNLDERTIICRNTTKLYEPGIKFWAACCRLLHLLQTLCLTSKTKEPEEKQPNLVERTITCDNITDLYEAGIKFRAADKFDSLLDIRFDKKKGILTIPKLLVEDATEHEFRNLIAFEQCHYGCCGLCVSNYIFIMDCLINTPRDVELLVGEGIIDNWLGSNEEVSKLFNSLGNNVNTCPNCYTFADLSKELNIYCKKPWNRYRAILKHTYFRHPWAVISVIYAAILLILTLISVVTGVISMLWQKEDR